MNHHLRHFLNQIFTPIKIFLFIILWSLLCFHFSAHAQCRGSGTRIFYGNGMFNSASDANNSLIELEKLDVSELESSADRIHYDLALNVSESSLENILTVVEQKVDGDLSYFWNVMDALLPMPDWLVAPMMEALQSAVDNDTLEHMLAQYETALSLSEKIVLVSHSQGNFYAAEAIPTLLEKYGQTEAASLGFANVRVGDPAPPNAEFPYFTFTDDQVMDWVRALTHAPPANLETLGAGLGPELDPLGHHFIKAYLTNDESREKIRQAMVDTALATAYPCF
jgi:hypothetical protein